MVQFILVQNVAQGSQDDVLIVVRRNDVMLEVVFAQIAFVHQVTVNLVVAFLARSEFWAKLWNSRRWWWKLWRFGPIWFSVATTTERNLYGAHMLTNTEKRYCNDG